MFSNIAFLTNAVSDKLVTLCQKFRVILYPLKDSGVSPASPYTARFGQDFDTLSANFKSFRCTKSTLEVNVSKNTELLLNPCIILSVKTDQFSTLYKSMGDILV